MSTGSESLLDRAPNHYQAVLVRQQLELQEIRSKASRRMQLVVAVISIAASIGFFRFLASGAAIQKLALNVPDEAINRCSPESIKYLDTTLHGVGYAVSAVAVGCFALAGYLVLEMWMANRCLQQSPQLHPRTGQSFWLERSGDLVVRFQQKWEIEANEKQLVKSKNLLQSVQRRFYLAIGLTGLGAVLIGLAYYNLAQVVFWLGPVLLILGAALLTWYLWKYYVAWDPEEDGLEEYMGSLARVAVVGVSLVVMQVVVDAVPAFWLLALGAVIAALAFLQPWGARTSTGERLSRLLDFQRVEEDTFHLRTRTVSPVFLSLTAILLMFLLDTYYESYLLYRSLAFC